MKLYHRYLRFVQHVSVSVVSDIHLGAWNQCPINCIVYGENALQTMYYKRCGWDNDAVVALTSHLHSLCLSMNYCLSGVFVHIACRCGAL